MIYNDVGIKDKRGDDYMDSKIAELKNIVAESNYIVFFGGAGVSTESGVPDFRSVDEIGRAHV